MQNSRQTHGTSGSETRWDQVLQDQRNKVPLPDRPTQNQVKIFCHFKKEIRLAFSTKCLHHHWHRFWIQCFQCQKIYIGAQCDVNVDKNIEFSSIFDVFNVNFIGQYNVSKNKTLKKYFFLPTRTGGFLDQFIFKSVC